MPIVQHLNRAVIAAGRIDAELHDADGTPSLSINWTPAPKNPCREIVGPAVDSTAEARPMRAEARAVLIRSIAQGRRWLDEIVGTADPDSIATREECSHRHIGRVISLAFLAPDLVKAVIDGRRHAVSG